MHWFRSLLAGSGFIAAFIGMNAVLSNPPPPFGPTIGTWKPEIVVTTSDNRVTLTRASISVEWLDRDVWRVRSRESQNADELGLKANSRVRVSFDIEGLQGRICRAGIFCPGLDPQTQRELGAWVIHDRFGETRGPRDLKGVKWDQQLDHPSAAFDILVWTVEEKPDGDLYRFWKAVPAPRRNGADPGIVPARLLPQDRNTLPLEFGSPGEALTALPPETLRSLKPGAFTPIPNSVTGRQFAAIDDHTIAVRHVALQRQIRFALPAGELLPTDITRRLVEVELPGGQRGVFELGKEGFLIFNAPPGNPTAAPKLLGSSAARFQLENKPDLVQTANSSAPAWQYVLTPKRWQPTARFKVAVGAEEIDGAFLSPVTVRIEGALTANGSATTWKQLQGVLGSQQLRVVDGPIRITIVQGEQSQSLNLNPDVATDPAVFALARTDVDFVSDAGEFFAAALREKCLPDGGTLGEIPPSATGVRAWSGLRLNNASSTVSLASKYFTTRTESQNGRLRVVLTDVLKDVEVKYEKPAVRNWKPILVEASTKRSTHPELSGGKVKVPLALCDSPSVKVLLRSIPGGLSGEAQATWSPSGELLIGKYEPYAPDLLVLIASDRAMARKGAFREAWEGAAAAAKQAPESSDARVRQFQSATFVMTAGAVKRDTTRFDPQYLRSVAATATPADLAKAATEAFRDGSANGDLPLDELLTAARAYLAERPKRENRPRPRVVLILNNFTPTSFSEVNAKWLEQEVELHLVYLDSGLTKLPSTVPVIGRKAELDLDRAVKIHRLPGPGENDTPKTIRNKLAAFFFATVE